MVLFFLMRAPQIQITRLTIWKFQGCDQLVESPKKEPSVPESTEEKPLASTETQSLCGAKAEPTETTETPADAALQSGSKDEKSETEKKAEAANVAPKSKTGFLNNLYAKKFGAKDETAAKKAEEVGKSSKGGLFAKGKPSEPKEAKRCRIFSLLQFPTWGIKDFIH